MDTQAKLILEEIDRRIETYSKGYARNDGARAEALALLRDEITGSITKEETETGLEKAAEEYEHERVYESELSRYFTCLETLGDGESPKMRMPSRDTEYFLNADIIEAFKAGAEWQKRKTVGSASEGGARAAAGTGQ